MLLYQGAQARPAAEEEAGLGPMVRRYGGRGLGGQGSSQRTMPPPHLSGCLEPETSP